MCHQQPWLTCCGCQSSRTSWTSVSDGKGDSCTLHSRRTMASISQTLAVGVYEAASFGLVAKHCLCSTSRWDLHSSHQCRRASLVCVLTHTVQPPARSALCLRMCGVVLQWPSLTMVSRQCCALLGP
jgi:hypothetical protein